MPEERHDEEYGEEQALELPYRRGPFAGLTPNVIRLGLVSFFADVSSEMLYPLTPLFLTTVLHSPVAIVGVIEGIAEATASLFRTVSGRLSDLSGRRRPYILAGYTLSALAKPIIGIAAGWPTVLGARVADRFGKGLRTAPRDALLADTTPEISRGKAFGWHRAMDTLGAVVGPLLALVLIVLLTGKFELQNIPAHTFRRLFFIAFFPGIVGAGLVLFVREHRHRQAVTRPTSIRYFSLPAQFRAYLIAWGVFAIANSSDIFLILRARQTGFNTTTVVILYALYNLIYAAVSPSLGELSDRIGRQRVLIGGLVIFALVYLGFAVANAAWQIWILFIIYGTYTAATDGVGKALAVDLISPDIRASGLGILATISGIATLIASSVAGVLWSTIAPWAAFAYGAIGAITAGILLLRIHRPTQQHA